jgi:hypothetical protein
MFYCGCGQWRQAKNKLLKSLATAEQVSDYRSQMNALPRMTAALAGL